MRLSPLMFGVLVGAGAIAVGIVMAVSSHPVGGAVMMIGGAFFLVPSLFAMAQGRRWLR